MKRFGLFVAVAVAACTTLLSQEKYIGQLMEYQLTNGETLVTDLVNSPPSPRFIDGKIKWVTPDWNRPYAADNVERVVFVPQEESMAQARQALIDFYNATDGDHWNNNTNWCSDKPIDEWFGVQTFGRPYPSYINLQNNGLKGALPSDDVFQRLGAVNIYNLSTNDLSGSLPQQWARDLTLSRVEIFENQITGNLPEGLGAQPLMSCFYAERNHLTGPMPASLANLMDDKNGLRISENDLSGDVPEEIVNHPNFHVMWDCIIPQGGHLNVPTIPGYIFPVTDLSGNQLETTDVYKNNQYTLIFNYSSSRGDFTDKLKKAYSEYKDKGFEVLGMAPGNAEAVNDFLHQNDITWLNLDPASFKNYIGRYYAYINYINLIDREGNIVFSSIMDENGKAEDTYESTRDQKVFDVLAEKFGSIDFTPYASTDYSRDGEVMTLQKASVGKGVDIVFVGNCFVDKDMEPGGLYERKMREAMEQFFAYEPYTSLRNRFNVYAVKAVSQNAEMYEGTKQAITSDADAFAYAQKVTALIPDRPMRVNIVYNTMNAGRSFTFMYDDNSYSAFMLTGINKVLNHEGGGHGIGRLYDEYVEEAGSTATDAVKDYYEEMWSSYGCGANIDMHADVSQTRWARLAADSRYAAEGLGTYEGSGTFNYGIYRPTQNSMMRYNDIPFNAPSREAIYKYVMQESEGPDWSYDYETFVKFDAKGRAEYAEAVGKGAKIRQRGENTDAQELHNKQEQPLPPVFKKGTWRDALANPTMLK